MELKLPLGFLQRTGVIFLLSGISLGAWAQQNNIGIGTTTPHNSAMLDVESANKGILIPRINLRSETDATTIASPETGLLIYNRNGALSNGAGFYYWTGVKWQYMGGGRDGADGKDGSFIYMRDEATPPISLGKEGDLYISKVSGAYYQKQGSQWVQQGVLLNAVQLQGHAVLPAAPRDGQVLIWDQGLQVWAPKNLPAVAGYTGNRRKGIAINSNNEISARYDTAMWNAEKLQGLKVSDQAPVNGEVLQYNNTSNAWEPQVLPAAEEYTAGSGITINAAREVSARNDTAMWNAEKLQGLKVSDQAPVNGEVLQYNNTSNAWEPQVLPAAEEYTAGSGITINAAREVSARNDTAMWNAEKLQGLKVSDQAPVNGEVLQYNNTSNAWEPQVLPAAEEYTAGTGITIDASREVSARNDTAMWNAEKLQGQVLSDQAPGNGEVLQYNSTSNAWEPQPLPETPSWQLGGNGNTDPQQHFIGTSDAKDMVLKTNGQERMRIRSNGNVSVNGSVTLAGILKNIISNGYPLGIDQSGNIGILMSICALNDGRFYLISGTGSAPATQTWGDLLRCNNNSDGDVYMQLGSTMLSTWGYYRNLHIEIRNGQFSKVELAPDRDVIGLPNNVNDVGSLTIQSWNATSATLVAQGTTYNIELKNGSIIGTRGYVSPDIASQELIACVFVTKGW